MGIALCIYFIFQICPSSGTLTSNYQLSPNRKFEWKLQGTFAGEGGGGGGGYLKLIIRVFASHFGSFLGAHFNMKSSISN